VACSTSRSIRLWTIEHGQQAPHGSIYVVTEAGAAAELIRVRPAR
jgi:hypothetical protein